MQRGKMLQFKKRFLQRYGKGLNNNYCNFRRIYYLLGAWGFAAAHEYIMRYFDSEAKVRNFGALSQSAYRVINLL